MVKRTLKSILAILFFSIQAVADTDFKTLVQLTTTPCKQQVQYLVQQEPAPCTGYLFSPDKELEVRIKVQSADMLKELTIKQDEIINIMNQRIDNMQKYNSYLSEELNRQDNQNFWRTSLYFGLGVLITGAIAANVNR